MAATMRHRGLATTRAATRYLQATVGNRGVAALMGDAARAVANQGGGHHGQTPVQREVTSADILEELAVPKVRPGPSVEVQKAIVDKLEDDELLPDYDIVNLGAIELTDLPAEDKDLIEQAVLINLDANRSAGVNGYEAVVHAEADRDVIENTLRTMIDAGQVRYLRAAGIPNAQWKVLVEVHYYRNRAQEQLAFHKDTLGQMSACVADATLGRAVASCDSTTRPRRLVGSPHRRRAPTSGPSQFASGCSALRASATYGTHLHHDAKVYYTLVSA